MLGISILVLIGCLLFLQKNDTILKAYDNGDMLILLDYDRYGSDEITFVKYEFENTNLSNRFIVPRSEIELRTHEGDYMEVRHLLPGIIFVYNSSLGYFRHEMTMSDIRIIHDYYELKYNDGFKDGLLSGGTNLLRNSQNGIVYKANNSVISPIDYKKREGYSEIWRKEPFTEAILSVYAEVFYEEEKIIVGEVYTESIEVMTTHNSITLSFDDATPLYFHEIQPYEWVRISRQRVFTSNINQRIAGLVSYDIPAYQSLYYRNYKLELGAVATPWTPAPEDVNQEYYEKGYNEGHLDGYMKGITEEMGTMGFWELIPNTVSKIWNETVVPIFEFDFFGVKILDIWTGLVAIAVSIFILKMWVL